MRQTSLYAAELPERGPFAVMNDALLEQLPVAMAVYDAEGTLLRYNERAAELWGHRPQVGSGDERGGGALQLLDAAGEPLSPDGSPLAAALRDGTARRELELWIERPDGSRRCLLTGIEPLRDESGAIAGLLSCFQDVTARKRDELALQRREEHFAGLLGALPVALYTTDAEGRITFYNEAAAELWGRRPVLEEDRWCGAAKLYGPDGSPMPHDRCPLAEALRQGRAIAAAEALVERPDGTRVHCLVYPTPLYDATGAMTGAVNMFVDLRGRNEAEERRLVLVKELNHRVKNTLATIQSIAMLTLRHSPDPASFRDAFEARLVALSRAHDLLTQGHWQSVGLESILAQELAPHGGGHEGRVRLRGAPVALWPRAALALALTCHELATNALRHGSLAVPQGSLRVDWEVKAPEAEGPGLLAIDWRECGGPPVEPPRHKGFGLQMLERSLRYDLKGVTRLDFRPEGLHCRIEIPLRGEASA